MRRILAFVATIVGAFILAGVVADVVVHLVGGGSEPGSSSQGQSDNAGSVSTQGAASFIGYASNAVMFIQWTRNGNSLSGSLQEEFYKEVAGESSSDAFESSSDAFTGTINGDGLTLAVNKGSLEGSRALSGTVTSEGFNLTFQGTHHNLITIDFVPGRISEYNAAVRRLETTGSPEEPTTTSSATAGGFPTDVEQCGNIQGPGAQFAVSTSNGISCAEARRVFADLFAGKGERHEGKDAAESYTHVDGWGCGSGAGGFGCDNLEDRSEYIGARALR